MKKFLSALIACALIVSMASMALATPPAQGQAVLEDDDDLYTDVVTSVAPGSTFWVYLERAYDGSDKSVKEPKNIKIDNVEIIDSDTGKDVKMLTVSKSPDRKPYGDDSKEKGYYAKVTVKSVSTSSYPKDGYDVDDLVLTYTSYALDDGGDPVTVPVDLTNIEYDEADDEFEEDAKMFSYDKDDDIDIDLPDDGGTFTGTARRDFEIVAAMDTKVDNSLLNKYPNADIRFFNGSGANFPVTSGKLTFNANSGDYLYEVSGSTLTDRSSTWSSSKNAFVVSTTVIGKYIVSDIKLSAKASTSSSTPASSSQGEYIGTTPPPSNLVVTNPQTGACA